MPTPDFFGILDATKRLTAPAGLESAHADGFSWARAGLTFGDSTKLTAEDWNRIIANLRMLLMATPGFDPDGRDPADPALMRDVITGFATAKIVELLPATVLDQADELAAALAAITAFVNTVVAAVPTNLNANNLTSGTVPDARLATKYKPVTLTNSASDLDTLLTDGWSGLVGPANANLPKSGYFHIFNLIYGAGGTITQIAFPYGTTAGITSNGMWMRPRYSGAWGAWSEFMQKGACDARYAQLAGFTASGMIKNTSGDIHSEAGQVMAGKASITGRSLLNPGTGTQSGYVSWMSPANLRQSYLGNALVNDYLGWTFENGCPGLNFTNGTVLIQANTVHHDGNTSRGAPDAVLEDQKAANTVGGAATSGSWETRTLNTEVRDPRGLVTLTSNQFVATVDGWVEWSAPGWAVNNHKTRLYNVTDSVVVAEGTSGFGQAAAFGLNRSEGGGAIVAGKTYRIENRVQTTKAGDGMGTANNFGGVEVYTRVLFWRS